MNESVSGISGDKLNKGPVDVWSTRERLALASAVMRSGNQNWVSVSRSLKPFVDAGRPNDWFSQINCARQYQEMLEKAGTSRRKRGDKDYSETPGDVIVRRLVTERIEELKATIIDLADKYKHHKKELELVKSTESTGDFKEMWQKLQMEKVLAMEAKKASEEQALKMHSPSKDELSTSQILELPYVQEACEVVDHNDPTTLDFLNDDQLSQSTSSSHVTENVISGDLQTEVDPIGGSFMATVKQENVSLEQDVQAEEDKNASDDLTTSEDRDIREETEAEQRVKVEVKDEPATLDDLVKDEESIIEEQVSEHEHHEQEHLDEDVTEQVEEEVTLETPDAEDDILISTEEIVEDINIDKEVLKPSDATTQELEADEDDTSNVDAGTSLFEADISSENVREDCNSKISTEEVEKKEVDEVEKDPQASPVYTPVEANIEEPKTHDSVDTEPSAVAETIEAKPTVRVKNEGDCSEPIAASSSDGSSKTKTPHQNKQSSSKSRSSKRESSRRRSNLKTPKTPAIKEEGKESEISSKAGSSDEEEGKNTDEPVKASGSFIRSKLDLNESLPNSPASVCNSDTEDERAHKVWKKAIMLVWRAISNHKFANIFMHPVTEDIAPGYHNVIFKPMDLNTIRKNIDLGIIRATREFQRDMMLMFTNALMYNHSSHDVHKMARVMYQDSMAQIEQFVNTQVMMRSEPKLLRTSRRSDTGISDKDVIQEEEMRKRKASEAEPCTPAPAKKRRH